MDNRKFIACFSKAVLQMGFKKVKRSNLWIRKGNEVSETIFLQKSIYGNLYLFNYGGVINNMIKDNMSHVQEHFYLLSEGSDEDNKILFDFLHLEDNTISDEKRISGLMKLFSGPYVVSYKNHFTSEDEVRHYIIDKNIVVSREVLDYLNISR